MTQGSRTPPKQAKAGATCTGGSGGAPGPSSCDECRNAALEAGGQRLTLWGHATIQSFNPTLGLRPANRALPDMEGEGPMSGPRLPRAMYTFCVVCHARDTLPASTIVKRVGS